MSHASLKQMLACKTQTLILVSGKFNYNEKSQIHAYKAIQLVLVTQQAKFA